MPGVAVSLRMEFPTPAQVLAGESFHYDAEGNACAVCCRCFSSIDLEFGEYAEVAVTRKEGAGREKTGRRWVWCGGCQGDYLPILDLKKFSVSLSTK